MKTSTKILLGTAATVGAAAYGTFTFIDNLLLNRHMVPSKKFSAKVTGCDLGDREGELNKHKKWLKDYGYEKLADTMSWSIYKYVGDDITNLENK